MGEHLAGRNAERRRQEPAGLPPRLGDPGRRQLCGGRIECRANGFGIANSRNTAVPAQAGTPLSIRCAADKWIPAFAGNAAFIDSAVRQGCGVLPVQRRYSAAIASLAARSAAESASTISSSASPDITLSIL